MNQSAMPAEFVRRHDVDVIMLAGRYTLLEQGALDDLLPLAVERGVGIVAAAVYNSGLLSRPRPPADALYDYGPAPAEMIARANAIADVCEEFGITLPEAAHRVSAAASGRRLGRRRHAHGRAGRAAPPSATRREIPRGRSGARSLSAGSCAMPERRQPAPRRSCRQRIRLAEVVAVNSSTPSTCAAMRMRARSGSCAMSASRMARCSRWVSLHGAVLVDGPPQARARGATDERLDDARRTPGCRSRSR